MFSSLWNWLYQIGLIGAFGVVGAQVSILTISKPAYAQITPDATLGVENSVVTPNVVIRGLSSDRISGGAIRGANLFHSFQEFNVGEGMGVYFTNPQGIENILSRVTGANPSEIFGRLGVLGNANLFLMNPNGIVFGQNASLDVEGSFLATTASAIALGEQGYFSATQPQQSSLLSVSPGALFFNQAASEPGNIINRGNLATGKDFTLIANNLDLQSQLVAGGNLTLQATDTVKIRDSVASPFLARSGGNLAIVGNQGIDILALNHPTQTPFISVGNLSLASDGIISGDARFVSGGSFSIHSASGGLANFVSLYDPIISSNGDVDVAANYTGASLLVESKGNIRFWGGINITRPDTNALPTGEDTATLSNSTALIMRSGQNTLTYGGVNSGSVPTLVSGTVPEGITLGGDVTLRRSNGSGGLVRLTTASGDVSTREITTNGGSIFINSAGAITTNGETLNARNGANNGGEISLKATNGNINTGNLNSYSYSASSNVADGGTISLKAANGSITTGSLDSSSESGSGNAANGGALAFTASGNIFTGDLNSYSYSVSGNTANGGALAFTASGNITTGNLDSSSNSLDSGGNGGMITFSALGNVTTGSMNSEAGGTGNGGDITLISNAGAIDTTIGTITSQIRDNSNGTGRAGTIFFTAKDNIQTALLNASAEKGNGGNIQLISNNGAIDTTRGNLATDSRSGNGGAIFLSALNNITTGRIISEAGGTGNGGDITLTSNNGAINTTAGDVATNSRNGNGGAIALSAINGSISTFGLNSYSSSNSGNAGQGGAIALSAGDNIDITDKLYSYSRSDSGNAGNGGSIILETRNGKISTSGLNSYSRSDSGNAGNGGTITLNAINGSISTSELNARSFANSSGSAGDGGFISLNAKDNINIKGDLRSSSISNSGTAGNGGAISLEAETGTITTRDLNSSSESSSGNGNRGNGGAITLLAPKDIMIQGSVNSKSSALLGTAGNGGVIRLQASNDIDITGDLISSSFVNTYETAEATGDAGTINLLAGNNIKIKGDLISDSGGTGFTGNGGTISLKAGNEINIIGKLRSALSSGMSITGNGGKISLFSAKTINIEGSLSSSTSSFMGTSGNGGEINLNAADGIKITGDLDSSSFSLNGTGANGGNITLLASNGSISTGNVDSSSSFIFGIGGNGGTITLEARDSISTGNLDSSSFSTSPSSNGGDIAITSYAGIFSSENRLIRSNAFKNGNGGDIKIDALSVALKNTELTTTTAGTGNAGNIFITADDSVLLDGSRLFTSLEFGGVGKGGDIKVEAEKVFLSSNSFIDTATFGQGNAGNVLIKANNSVLLDSNSAIFSITGGEGNAGNVTVNARETIELAKASNISTAVNSTARGDGGEITVEASSLFLREGSQLVTTTLSSGKAGTINVNTRENVIISGVDPNFTPTPPRNIKVTDPSSLEEVEPNDSIDQAQPLTEFFLNQPNNVDPNVEFSTNIPYVSISAKGSAVSFSPSQDHYSFEVTRAGTVAIFDLDKPGQDRKIAQVTNTRLRLFDSAGNELATNSSASPTLGAGGSNDPNPATRDPYIRYVFNKVGTYLIQVESIGDQTIDGISEGAYTLQVSLETPNVLSSVINGVLASGLFARSESTGAAGNVTINAPELKVQEGAQISASTSSRGQGGNITVTAPELLSIGDNSQLSVETSGVGRAGNVTLNTNILTVDKQAAISATSTATATTSEQGGSIGLNANRINLFGKVGIFAETQGVVPAGSLSLQPYNNGQTLDVNFAQGARISASTSGSGQGGSLIVKASEAVTIAGDGQLAVETSSTGRAGDINITTQRLTIRDNAKVLASTTTDSRGQGGSINIQGNRVTLNNSEISARTLGAGNGGNINIDLDELLSATNSNIVTAAQQSDGGAIAITADEIRLYGDSDITTNVGSGTGGGGDINLTAASIIAFGDSDILSFASDGKGGNIFFNTPAFFGQNYQPAAAGTNLRTLDQNNRVDINASGAVSGVITLPDTSFIQNSLSELPDNVIDTSSLIANSCIARNTRQQQGTFIITGSGGLPSRPGDALMSQYTFGTVRTNNASLSANSIRRPWQKGDPIVEPQGVYRLHSGRLVLSRECSE